MSTSTSNYHHGNLREEVLRRGAEIIGESGIEALSLRAIARDLGVSHGAPNRHFRTKSELLSELGATAWLEARDAVLNAAAETGSTHPLIRLNAMGRGYLKWALQNKPYVAVTHHPDIRRYASPEIESAIAEFRAVLHETVVECQNVGRHPSVDSNILTLFTKSVPYGLAALLIDSDDTAQLNDSELDHMVSELIELVVPIKQLEC